LKRVIAPGVAEDEAKTDVCRAMADGKIAVRVRVATSNHGTGGGVYSGGNVGVPPHLGPSDLDWVQSRPLKPWSIGPMPGQHYVWTDGWQDRPIDLIELSTADVKPSHLSRTRRLLKMSPLVSLGLLSGRYGSRWMRKARPAKMPQRSKRVRNTS